MPESPDGLSKNPYSELAKRFFITFLIGVVVYRLGVFVPVPGVDYQALQDSIQGAEGTLGRVLAYANMFNGGAITNSSIFGLGIMPYISASIIFQLLTFSIPALKELKKEGEVGRRKINQYTRYATLAICLVQSLLAGFALTSIENGALVTDQYPTTWFIIQSMVIITTGSMVLLWLAEQITKFGIGNGVSVIIMIGILSGMPGAIGDIFTGEDASLVTFLVVLAIFFAVIAAMVVVTMSRRKINLEQQRRVQGNKVYGGGQTQLPLMLNHANVIPVIFGSPVMVVLGVAGTSIGLAGLFEQGSAGYRLTFAALIIFFTYFYIAITMDLNEMANHFKQAGFFIRGVKPGQKTVEYIRFRLWRITFVGALSLAFIALMPDIIGMGVLDLSNMTSQAIVGGTGMLIVVGVSIDIIQKVAAFLMANQMGMQPGAGGGMPAKRGGKRF